MESLKEYLLPKSYSTYGYMVAVANALAGVIVTFITGIRKSERRQFQCDSHGILADKDFLTTKCLNQYDEQYNDPLPLYCFALVTFTILVVFCIIYSWCCVKSRVDYIEQECTPNTEDVLRPAPVTTRSIFKSYMLHLLVRFGFGIFFAFLQLSGIYASSFPSQFQCEWNYKRTSSANFNKTYKNSSSKILIDCANSFAGEKTTLAKLVWILHLIFAFLVVLEALYLLREAFVNKTFMRDSEFCKRHLFNKRRIPLTERDFSPLFSRTLQQTEYNEPLIPTASSEVSNRRAIDDVYVELIIHPGRVTHDFDMSRHRHELLDVYLKPPAGLVPIKNIDELFNSEEESYHNILIVGRPGIGKTLLCTKIVASPRTGTLSVQPELKRVVR